MKRFVLALGMLAFVYLLAGCNNAPQSVTGNNIGDQQIAATTVYEAENATLSGGANKNNNHNGSSGGYFVDGFYNSTTAQVSFTVNVASAGSYTLMLHYSAGNGTSSNTGLYVNSTTTKLKNITCNATANWDTWADENETVTLNAGNNTIIYKAVTSSSACINLDKLTVTNSTTTYYTVTFNKNDAAATGTMAAQSIASGLAAQLTANGYAKAGATFAGWATSSTGSVAYADKASYTMGTANVTLYAKWTTAPTYTLTYNGNGNTGGTVPATVSGITSGSSVVVASPGTLVKTNNTFAGWNTASNGSGASYNAGSNIVITANTTLNAIWTPIGNSTTYEAENATLSGGANKNNNHNGSSGGYFVDGFYNSTTAQVSFTVNVASAGNYTLTLHYSAGNGTSSNTGLYVNSTTTKLKNITCNATANWDSWADETETVTLNAGNNTINYKAVASSSSCINLDKLTVTANGCVQSVPPTGILATSFNVCAGSAVTLSVSGGTLGTGASWKWYSDAAFTAPVGSGTTITVTPTTTVTYYVRGEGSCNNTAGVSATITVSIPSIAPIGVAATSFVICPGTTATLTVLGGSLGTGASWKWYTDASCTNQFGTGFSIVVSTPQTYYVRAEGLCNNTITAMAPVSLAPLTLTPNPPYGYTCLTQHIQMTITPSCTYQSIAWYYNPFGIAGDDRLITPSNTEFTLNGNTLTFNGVEGPSWIYCVVTDAAGRTVTSGNWTLGQAYCH